MMDETQVERDAPEVMPFAKVAMETVGAEMTEGDAIDAAYKLKAEITEKTKELDGYKKLFKKTGEVGEQIEGKEGYVLLTQKQNVSVEPGKLYGALKDAEFPVPFYDLLSVKIADSRKVLGTSIFSKIETKGKPSLAVTIGKRK